MKIFKIFWHYISKTPIIWVGILSILVISSALAPFITNFDPIRDADFSNVLLPPFYIEGGNTTHFLGTDQIG